MFFVQAAKELKFDTSLVEAVLDKAWLNEDPQKIVTVEDDDGDVQNVSFYVTKTPNKNSMSSSVFNQSEFKNAIASRGV